MIELPEELFDTYAVLKEVKRKREESGSEEVITLAKDVSDTLDAVVHLVRQRVGAEATPASTGAEPAVTVRYDLSPAMTEGAIRDQLIAMGWAPPAQDESALVDAVKSFLSAMKTSGMSNGAIREAEDKGRKALAQRGEAV